MVCVGESLRYTLPASPATGIGELKPALLVGVMGAARVFLPSRSRTVYAVPTLRPAA